MVVTPKMRGFICTTSHPAGCGKNVENAVKKTRKMLKNPVKSCKNALIIGGSTGYGLACRIVAAFGYGAGTAAVSFDKEGSGKRTGTAGYYNNKAFDKLCREENIPCHTINGDAYSREIKEEVVNTIKNDPQFGKLDLVIYSLAAPRRTGEDGEVYNSVIKPIGKPFTSKTLDFHTGVVSEITVENATEQEIHDTVKVMGGEDWRDWIEFLKENDILAENALTIAFSYIGPELTHAVYTNGTIGRAKEDLEEKCREINEILAPLGGKSFVSVNKALVTQASAAIPVVPLYITLLYKIMKENGDHEDCTEQMIRMFSQRLYTANDTVPVDDKGRIRMDDFEMKQEVQDKIAGMWESTVTENVAEAADLEGYRSEFLSLFGFGVPGVDYSADVEI